MAHESQSRFFEIMTSFFPEHFAGAVLDVGSLDINGGPHRSLTCRRYVGVDLGEGPNVTLVARGEELDFKTNEFDVSMSSECFEHNPDWQATLYNMIRMTRPGGLLAITCATTGRAEHGTTRTDGGFSAPLATELGQEYYGNVTARQLRRCLSGSRVDMAFTVAHRPFSDLMVGILREGASATDQEQFRLCEIAVRSEFDRGRYPGGLVRHASISLLGDPGARLHDGVASRLQRVRKSL